MTKLPKKEISLTDGVIVFALAIGANLAVQFVYGAILGLMGRESAASDYEQLAVMAVMQLSWLASTIIYFIVRKRNPKLLYPIEDARPSAALSLILPILCIAGFYLLTSSFDSFLGKINYQKNPGIKTDTAGKFVFAIIVMVILAPFCEELIFRGVLFSGLCKKLNPYIAALLSAVAFTFMHMNPEQTLYQFFLGYACALAAYKSGSIVTSMVLHSGSNLIAVLLGISKIGNAFAKAVNALTRTPAIAALSTIVLALGCGAAIYGICEAMKKLNIKYSRRKHEESSEGEGVNPAGEESAPSAAVSDSKNTKDFVIYGVTTGLCAFMWILVFIQAMKGA